MDTHVVSIQQRRQPATRMLQSGKRVEENSLLTPKGIQLLLKIEQICIEKNWVRCAVKKDAGDDADITDGILSMRP